MVVSSILLIRPGLPLLESSGAGDLIRSLFWYMSPYQNMKSSAVKGAPSDHFMPLRRNNVVRRPSALVSRPFATLGAILVPVTSQNNSLSEERTRLPFSLSPGPRKPRRQVPPYLPTLRSGLITIGSCGMRLSTDGNLPALTSSASAGASPNFFGHCAGSVMMVGFSSFPTDRKSTRLNSSHANISYAVFCLQTKKKH